MQPFGGPAEMQFLGDGDETPELLHVHSGESGTGVAARQGGCCGSGNDYVADLDVFRAKSA
ncbi:hypothetical protein GCM10009555_058190 [Acrocarpospora macrocephala]|uniref:Uncharacterized protein n=1 Tax=Acrocarpospora macrocephala TaxID=150177 RepID=A0A5M3WTU9_9ACTN|nr:hypothetical protein Amac_055530 [Acrocarpospora macrocephala]